MPFPPTCPRIDYDELDYLMQVDDRERVERISDRLESAGIPACVQTVTVRAEARQKSETYRVFVPAEQIALAQWAVFEEPIAEDRQVAPSPQPIAIVSSRAHRVAADQLTAPDQVVEEP